jgi:hypothetical protein
MRPLTYNLVLAATIFGTAVGCGNKSIPSSALAEGASSENQDAKQAEKEKKELEKKVANYTDPWLKVFEKQTEKLASLLEKHTYATRRYSVISWSNPDFSGFPELFFHDKEKEIAEYKNKLIAIEDRRRGKVDWYNKEQFEIERNKLRRGLIESYGFDAKSTGQSVSALQSFLADPARYYGHFRVPHYAGGMVFSDEYITDRLNKTINDTKVIQKFLEDELLPAIRKKYD